MDLKTKENILKQISQQAISLEERILIGSVTDDKPRIKNTISDKQIARWKKLSARGNDNAFKRRLAWDNLNERDIKKTIGLDIDNIYISSPEWLSVIEAIFNNVTDRDWQNEEELISKVGDDISLIEILLHPFVELGFDRLQNNIVHLPLNNILNLSNTTAKISISLKQSLLSRLLPICRPVIEHEIIQMCTDSEKLLYDTLGNIPKIVIHKYGSAFVCSVQNDQYAKLFIKYPVLAKLIALAIINWISATSLFIKRLSNDYEVLKNTYTKYGSKKNNMIINITQNLSDPHNNGMTVNLLEFESGDKIIYKPRSLSLEISFVRLLKWFNNTINGYHRQKIVIIIERKNYGWMEYVDYHACSNQLLVKRYYERLGILLAILYILHGEDIHAENIIASGEYPVIIDLECMMCGKHKEGPHSTQIIREDNNHSVQDIGLLPRWDYQPQYDYFIDPTGIGKSNGTNAPSVYGCEIKPYMYLKQVLKGFDIAYKHIMKQKNTLLCRNGLIDSFRGCISRIIIRRTDTYKNIYHYATRPEYLRNGIDHSICYELLYRALISSERKPTQWLLIIAEKNAMLRGDIPYFSAEVDSKSITFDNGETISNYYDETGMSAVKMRIAELSDKDLAHQKELIVKSFKALRLDAKDIT